MSALRAGVCFDVNVLHQPRYRATLSRLDVLLFPELLDGGYAALRSGMPPHSFGDSFLTSLRQSSKELKLTIVAGSMHLKDGTSRPTNTSLAFSNGRLIHRYDKIHLFRPTGDMKYFGKGKRDAGTFPFLSSGGKLRGGVVICFDLRFPELPRALALRGMDVLFVPARWPAARDDAWQTLLKARAIENQVFVVGCNSTDDEGGYSYAFDPLGQVIFSNRKSHKKALHTFTLDLRRLKESKRLHRNLQEATFLRNHLK